MDLSELSPAYVRSIAPYQPGKPISELARELGLDERKIVKLASNFISNHWIASERSSLFATASATLTSKPDASLPLRTE